MEVLAIISGSILISFNHTGISFLDRLTTGIGLAAILTAFLPSG